MKMHTNLTGPFIVGAVALFLGLAANLHAIPMGAPDDLDANEISGTWHYGQSAHHFTQWGSADSADQIRSGPFAVQYLSQMWATSALGGFNSPGSHFSHGWATNALRGFTWKISHFDRAAVSQTVSPVGSTVSVPDGGTTAIMLGAALCGLCLLRRKEEA